MEYDTLSYLKKGEPSVARIHDNVEVKKQQMKRMSV